MARKTRSMAAKKCKAEFTTTNLRPTLPPQFVVAGSGCAASCLDAIDHSAIALLSLLEQVTEVRRSHLTVCGCSRSPGGIVAPHATPGKFVSLNVSLCNRVGHVARDECSRWRGPLCRHQPVVLPHASR